MLVPERQKKIITIVNKNKTARVSELSKLLKVTEETIRRDLEKLETEGKLARTHGGAISTQEEEGDIPYFQREVMNQEEKMAVAKEAVKLIKDDDIIFLDASSTALYLAKLLTNHRITVLTNAIRVSVELANLPNVQVIVVGGNLSPSSLSLVGPLTVNTLERYHVNKVFFSCKGLHKQWGISDSNEQQAIVKRKMIEMADEKILLLDHTKLERKAFAHIEKEDMLDTIVIDSQANKTYLQYFEEKDITILFAQMG
ncbi:DeoR/GlpR family DNA-binding transcription regulator [Bacillus sp. FJAT-22090]|uniref:DeoR/GlpR family DNA-binding transcription regulator n=1 Tax=Bacillus sp. FJAT-22090 TaxID=1581038 RepID=UPI0011A7A478|nr:DeoR/GlpR family DNA-binding transcription regulator [Bacillus sp. FJAT-22090]